MTFRKRYAKLPSGANTNVRGKSIANQSWELLLAVVDDINKVVHLIRDVLEIPFFSIKVLVFVILHFVL